MGAPGGLLRWSLKALLCGRGDEWRRFDALFDANFLPPNKRVFAQRVVISAAQGALRNGEPKLVRIFNDRIQPEESVEPHTMSCTINGTIELFIQLPHEAIMTLALPAPPFRASLGTPPSL